MKNNAILGLIFIVCILTACSTTKSSEKKLMTMVDTDMEISMTERYVEVEEMDALSDTVVIGEFKKMETSNIKNKNSDNKNPDVVIFEQPNVVYTFKVSKVLKGENKKKTLEIIFVGNLPEGMKTNTEYLLYLEKNGLNKDKYLSLVSYVQAFFEKGMDNEWVNRMGQKANY